MPAWIPILVTIGMALATAALGFAFKTWRAIATHEAQYVEHSKILECIPDLQQRVARSEQNDETFWKIIGPHMSNVILSPDHTTRDHLIHKLDEGTLTYDEGLRLNSTLAHAFLAEQDMQKKTGFAFKLAQVRCWLNDEDAKRKKVPSEGVSHSCGRGRSTPTHS